MQLTPRFFFPSARLRAGDQVSRKGALTGGYHDERRSRLEAMKRLSKSRRDMGDMEEKSAKLKSQVNEINQSINIVTGEIQRLEARRAQERDAYQTCKVLFVPLIIVSQRHFWAKPCDYAREWSTAARISRFCTYGTCKLLLVLSSLRSFGARYAYPNGTSVLNRAGYVREWSMTACISRFVRFGHAGPGHCTC